MKGNARSKERWIRVELELEPSGTFDCPMTDLGCDVDDVRINAVGDRCIVEITPADEDSIVRLEGTVGGDCLCAVCHENGCAPQVTRIKRGTVRMTTYASTREDVRELVSGLRALADTVRVVGLAVTDETGVAEEVTFDLTTLTAKQREAFELAVRRGYLEADSDLKLADLAEELGISKAALSQRMRAGQAKLIKSVFEDSVERSGHGESIESSPGVRGPA